MKKHFYKISKAAGFTLVELVIFIIVTGILASTILLTFRASLIQLPNVHYTIIATQLADRCMEGFIGQRRLLGYASTPCSASPALPSLCTAPSGYSIAATVSCSPTLAGDTTTSKTVVVTVTGLGRATLTMLLADY